MAGPSNTYTSDLPKASQQISSTQAPINSNFQAIAELIAVNHVTFNTADDFGKHKWVSLPVQASAPTFDSGDTGIYNKEYATTSKNEMYIHKITNAGTADIPFSASSLSNVTSPSAGGTGWTYLPSGMIIKWAQVSATAAGATLNFNSGGEYGPNFTTLLVSTATALNGATKNVAVGYLGGGSVTVYAESGSQATSVMAIGY